MLGTPSPWLHAGHKQTLYSVTFSGAGWAPEPTTSQPAPSSSCQPLHNEAHKLSYCCFVFSTKLIKYGKNTNSKISLHSPHLLLTDLRNSKILPWVQGTPHFLGALFKAISLVDSSWILFHDHCLGPCSSLQEAPRSCPHDRPGPGWAISIPAAGHRNKLCCPYPMSWGRGQCALALTRHAQGLLASSTSQKGNQESALAPPARQIRPAFCQWTK